MNPRRWFVAVLVVRSSVSGPAANRPLIDLQYRIIRAGDAEEAYARALALGEQESRAYRNEAGEEVRWEFAGLHDLHAVEDERLSDGAEVYSRLVRDDPQNLVHPKERLSVFWIEANKHRTARELFEDG